MHSPDLITAFSTWSNMQLMTVECIMYGHCSVGSIHGILALKKCVVTTVDSKRFNYKVIYIAVL